MADETPSLDDLFAVQPAPSASGDGASYKSPVFLPETGDEAQKLQEAFAAGEEKKPNYYTMPWSEVAGGTARAAPMSFLSQLSAPFKMVSGAIEGKAPEAISEVGGDVRKLPYAEPQPMAKGQTLTPSTLAKQWVTPEESGIGKPMTDEDMRQQEERRLHFWSEYAKPFTATYGAIQGKPEDTAALKQMLTTDPFSYLQTISLPITGLSSLAGTESTLGKGLTGLSTVMDPLKGTIKAADFTAQTVIPSIAKKMASGLTGRDKVNFETAYKAGQAQSPEIRQVFNEYAGKNGGDPVKFVHTLRDAISEIKNEEINKWKSSKEALSGAATTDIPIQPIRDALDAKRQELGPRNLALDPSAHDVLDKLENHLSMREAYPSGSPERTLAGFDRLKQELYDQAYKQPTTDAKNAMLSAHAAVRKGLSDVAPEYDSLMGGWQQLQTDLNNIEKTSGGMSKSAASSIVSKLVRDSGKIGTQQVLQRLADKDPKIPFMVSGAALHDPTPGGMRAVAEGLLTSGLGILAGHQGFTGDIGTALKTGAAAAAVPIVSSPYVLGKAAYGLGVLSQSSPILGAKIVKNAAVAAQPYASASVNAYERANPQAPPKPSYQSPYFPESTGGRVERKSGGRVSSEDRGDALVRSAEAAKNRINQTTEPLLAAHDDHIAKALEIAQQNI
jgi:hypothetical protein